jgi:acyl-CoA dehydrogenase
MTRAMGLVEGDLAVRASRIADEFAAPAADDVDRLARFPAETINALRADRMLSVLAPRHLGGEGSGIASVALAVEALGRACASSAMIFAMHQIQVACLVRHGRSPALRELLQELADSQLLFGSATTEAGVGGDVRSSTCAVETDGTGFTLQKNAPVISYGVYADAIFATARRTPDSPPNDQVLVACRAPGLSLEPTSEWNTMGFRGTCSPGFMLRGSGPASLILDDPYGDISAQTMLPVSHILWGSAWLGLATAAVNNARLFVRTAARSKPGVTPPGALRLAELMVTYEQFAELVHSAAARFDRVSDDTETTTSLRFAIDMNSLKVAASTLVVDIVGRALLICGIAGYREDSPYRMGRLLRDSYGAALMVNNDRILANNAQLLLVHKD